MPATNGALLAQYQSYAASTPVVASAFTDNTSQADLLQIANDDGTAILAAVDYTGTVQFNASGLTASLGSGGTGKYTLNRQVIGQFRTNPGTTITTVAQAFAAAFPTNPQNQDIIQIVQQGANVAYYVDSLGVSHGS